MRAQIASSGSGPTGVSPRSPSFRDASAPASRGNVNRCHPNAPPPLCAAVRATCAAASAEAPTTSTSEARPRERRKSTATPTRADAAGERKTSFAPGASSGGAVMDVGLTFLHTLDRTRLTGGQQPTDGPANHSNGPEEDEMFLGFLIGTICLIALIRVLTRRRWYGGYHHWGYAHAGPYGWGYGGPRWHGRGRGFLFSILARLEATPTQEKAILGAFDELKDTARELRGTVRETRGDIARTVQGPAFD